MRFRKAVQAYKAGEELFENRAQEESARRLRMLLRHTPIQFPTLARKSTVRAVVLV